ncbi:hypothetical protein Dpep_0375 [Dethiosulfovibrio peptidovorans DSM 11002]|uniref:Uncharacterized protein n=1 Tax=Dethiosulfovibrio peptidovorans DSM 11002 TaxID=469381 RepID=D2Z3V1_9BACT|nr:hypothetical protein [Dethiosulfovibrio peptidovorans]EFC90407.1 hypothetical protein Dpep_0375 [Dethiosulfovibrio peptidovorans DSM 11002]
MDDAKKHNLNELIKNILEISQNNPTPTQRLKNILNSMRLPTQSYLGMEEALKNINNSMRLPTQSYLGMEEALKNINNSMRLPTQSYLGMEEALKNINNSMRLPTQSYLGMEEALKSIKNSMKFPMQNYLDMEEMFKNINNNMRLSVQNYLKSIETPNYFQSEKTIKAIFQTQKLNLFLFEKIDPYLKGVTIGPDNLKIKDPTDFICSKLDKNTILNTDIINNFIAQTSSPPTNRLLHMPNASSYIPPKVIRNYSVAPSKKRI